jgi:hypothetical protein
MTSKLTAKKESDSLLYWINEHPTQSIAIAASQGHTTVTQFEHYINMSFDEVDKLQMKKYIGGWI